MFKEKVNALPDGWTHRWTDAHYLTGLWPVELKIACYKQFFLSSQSFLPVLRTFYHFQFEIVVCKLFQIRCLKFVVWERVNQMIMLKI